MAAEQSRRGSAMPNRSQTATMKSLHAKKYGDALALPRLSGGADETGGYVGKADLTVENGSDHKIAQGAEIGKSSTSRACLILRMGALRTCSRQRNKSSWPTGSGWSERTFDEAIAEANRGTEGIEAYLSTKFVSQI
jgi:hypothetical protein